MATLKEMARFCVCEVLGEEPTDRDVDSFALQIATELDRLDWEDWCEARGIDPYVKGGPRYPGLGKWGE